MGIKAIETVYNGYRFRSRLEARWAVFFDALKIEYQFESEGFDLGDAGYYLPDFWLPSLGCWLEIKGNSPSSDDLKKVQALGRNGSAPALLAIGYPPSSYEPFNQLAIYCNDVSQTGTGGWYDHHAYLTYCIECQVFTLEIRDGKYEYGRRSLYNGQWEQWNNPCTCTPSERRNNYIKVLSAGDIARQARFEHGETPRIP